MYSDNAYLDIEVNCLIYFRNNPMLLFKIQHEETSYL